MSASMSYPAGMSAVMTGVRHYGAAAKNVLGPRNELARRTCAMNCFIIKPWRD